MTAPLPEVFRQLPPRVLLDITVTAALTAVCVVALMVVAALCLYARSCRAMEDDIERGELKPIANQEGQ